MYNLKEKIRERNVDKEINEKMNQLPMTERKRIQQEEERKRRLDLKETCTNLWKLRSREKRFGKEQEKVSRLKRIESKEEKLRMIETILEEIREENKKFEEEKNKMNEKLNKEKKTRQEQKIRKENEKKRKLEKQKMLSERWAMLRWITTYIKENQEEWDKEKKEKEDLERKELDEWNKMKRFEKVKKLQEKWKIKSKNQETPVPEQDDNKPPADTWRELPFPLETVNCESVPVPVPDPVLGQHKLAYFTQQLAVIVQ